MRYNYNQFGNSGFQGANIALALTFAKIIKIRITQNYYSRYNKAIKI